SYFSLYVGIPLGTPAGTPRHLRPGRASPGRRSPRRPGEAVPETAAAAPAGGTVPQGPGPVALVGDRGPPARQGAAGEFAAVERSRLPEEPGRPLLPGARGRNRGDPEERPARAAAAAKRRPGGRRVPARSGVASDLARRPRRGR